MRACRLTISPLLDARWDFAGIGLDLEFVVFCPVWGSVYVIVIGTETVIFEVFARGRDDCLAPLNGDSGKFGCSLGDECTEII